MGKKRRHPDIEEVLARPWCYYCERDFDDLKILISHQKAKHFKCERCGRRLNTAGGLAVHLNQVHKETLNAVENALPSRQSLDVEIFGMEGIPDDVRQQHDQRVTLHFWEEDAQRRAATGNPTPGDAQSNAPKKAKFDAGSDIKARLAAFKAKKAAGDTGSGSGSATPREGAQQIQSPALPESPGYPMAASPIHALPGAQATPPPGIMNPYAQYQQPPALGPPGGPLVYGAPVTGYPGLPPFQPPYQASPPFSQGPYQPPLALPPNPLLRPGSIPGAPGLPQRPAFSAPSVNAAQFQQMHHGQASLAPGANGNTATPDEIATASAVDDLIASAVKNAMGDKKVKKDKSMNLVFAVDDICAEEKTNQLARYASPKRNRVTSTA